VVAAVASAAHLDADASEKPSGRLAGRGTVLATTRVRTALARHVGSPG
jgi:hypothetical protein